MTDYASVRAGGASYPLSSAITNALLKDADPVVYYALDFFKSVLETNLGARIAAEATAAGVSAISAAVASTLPTDPAPFLLGEEFQFPLLAIHRKETTISEHTICYTRAVCDAQVFYVLPPVTAGQAERLMPTLKAVRDILWLRTELGFDPAYTPPGAAAGASVWTLSGLDRILFTGDQYGAFDPGGEMFFPTWMGKLRIVERSSAVAADYEAYAGADVALDFVDPGDGTTLSDVVNIATKLAPTVTAASPTTGSHNGGTTVTLTGTLFASGARVFFGTVEATGVVVVSAVSITCVTPAHVADLVDVTVTNIDAQSGTKTDAFTFT